MPTQRLFVGLLPPPVVQTAIEKQRLAWRFPPSALPTRRQRLHLTLHFLGEVEPACTAELRQALEEVRMEAIELSLCRPELWGVAVVRPAESEALRALHARIALPLQRLGLPAGGRWTPHVTIARNTRGAVPPDTAEPVPWLLRDFVLVWSRFLPWGRYEVLARYPAR